MCVLNVAFIDTTPGENRNDPFCPPWQFDGTDDDYKQFCRQRYSSDIMFSQRMLVIARYALRPKSEVVHSIQIVGPYAKPAKEIITALQNSLAEPKNTAA